MNAIDLIILGLGILAALHGFRRGFALTAGQYAGMFGGLVGGALVAPAALSSIGVDDPLLRTSLALAIVLAGLALGLQLGTLAAIPVRQALIADHAAGVADSTAGAVLSVAVALVGAYFLARSLDRGPNEDAARLIQQS